MPETKGINETKDVVRFLGVLGAATAGNPDLVAAFKAKDPKAIGQAFLTLATGPSGKELMAAGSAAFECITEVPAEIKDLGFMEGAELTTEFTTAAVRVFTAYKAAHQGA